MVYRIELKLTNKILRTKRKFVYLAIGFQISYEI